MIQVKRVPGAGWVVCLFTLLATAAWGQNPTLSLEATAINGKQLETPKSHIAVKPGDIISATIFVRDWSPAGEQLRAYQASIDANGFTSGYTGKIFPVDFDNTSAKMEENTKNAVIDLNHPRFVFKDLPAMPIIDSISWGYRFLAILVNRADALVREKQDGTKFYCGTVRLQVSDDANGPFIIGLEDDPSDSVLKAPHNRTIIPLDFERLQIDVSGVVPLRIIDTDPPKGAIDARRTALTGTMNRGWDTVKLKLSGAPNAMDADAFAIEDGSSAPPRVTAVELDGPIATLKFDRGIRRGAWTSITHKTSQTGTRIGFLPGDVNNDGVTNAADVFDLIYAPVGEKAWPLYRTDLDRDGAFSVRDVLCVIDGLTEPGAFRAALGR